MVNLGLLYLYKDYLALAVEGLDVNPVELVDRIKNGGTLPMFTSCCPGWVRFVKSEYPEFAGNLSTAKSPQQMFGAVAKSYFANRIGVDPRNIFCVSIMPCVAKKAEAALPYMNDACGDPDVDVVLTTRELSRANFDFG